MAKGSSAARKTKEVTVVVNDHSSTSQSKKQSASAPRIIADIAHSVDEAALAQLIGGDIGEGYTIDEAAKTVHVKGLVLPLHLVRKKCLKSTSSGVQYPPEAYAFAPDLWDPSTWCFRLWESPTARITTKSLWAVSEEIFDAPEEIRAMALPKLKEAWNDLYGSSANCPAFCEMDAELDDVGEDDIEERVGKPGVDEQANTFRYRLENPDDFTQGSFRTIQITNGVHSVIGKKPGGTVTQLQSLIFDKTRFPTKASVTQWLRAHPDIRGSKRKKEAEEGYDELIAAWEDHGHDFLYKAGGDAGGRFVFESEVRVPPALAAVPTPTLKAVGFKPQYLLRCETLGSPGAAWAVALDSNVFVSKEEDSQLCLSSPVAYPVPLQVTKDAGAQPLGEIRTEIVATGNWEIVYASADVMIIRMASEAFGEMGLILNGDRNFWAARVYSSASKEVLPFLEEHLKQCWKNRSSWLLWPTEDASAPYQVLDVNKTVKHALPFRLLKSEHGAHTQQYTLGVAYPANRVDAHGEFATEADLERAAWDYALNHRTVGARHKNGTEGSGVVVESYIYRGPTWDLYDASGNYQTILPGDWLLGVVWSNEIWKDIESGNLVGYSFEGWSF